MPELRQGLGFGAVQGEQGERKRRHQGHRHRSRLGFGARTRRARESSSEHSDEHHFDERRSGRRCSFGSDHESLFSPLSIKSLAGSEPGGPDPVPVIKTPPFQSRPKFSPREESEEGEDTIDPRKQSFSHALRECQNRRYRSEVHPASGRKHRRRRPASLDFNQPQAADASILSPRFLVGTGTVGGMKRTSAGSSRSRSSNFPSPGTPNYRPGAGVAAYQKGWSSERVPLPTNSCRRYAASGVLLPFANGRALPSKWEDAEKWIMSPVSGDGVTRASMPPAHYRRPKSKSGPLGAPGGIGLSSAAASPLVPCFDSGRVNFTAGSPLLAGVLIADRRCCANGSNTRDGGDCGGVDIGGRRSYSANGDPYILRSASVHGWSDMLIESSSSLQSPQDERLGSSKEVTTMLSPVILRRDMATQMSPSGSTQSSPKSRPSLSRSPQSTHPMSDLESHFSKLEVRDVEVDDRVTVTRWSKKHITRGSDGRSTNIIQWKKRSVEARPSAWEVTETAKCMSKCKREEAKIIAWENLQKAKAEAAIRKLEMKLEKKRSSSMDKILNKLRSAQKKAQEMRNTVNASQPSQVARTTQRVSSFRRTGKMSPLSGCFACHAF